MVRYQTECIICKKIFLTNVAKELFCGNKCLSIWVNQTRNIDLIKDIRPNRQCLNCKIIFIPKTRSRNCCSQKCNHNLWIKNYRKKFNNYRKNWRKKKSISLIEPVTQPVLECHSYNNK